MSEYLIKVEELRNKLNSCHNDFKRIPVLYPTISKKSFVAVDNILQVSGKYISALNNFLESKKNENQINNEEKQKIQGIFDYYKGMKKILSHYDVS